MTSTDPETHPPCPVCDAPTGGTHGTPAMAHDCPHPGCAFGPGHEVDYHLVNGRRVPTGAPDPAAPRRPSRRVPPEPDAEGLIPAGHQLLGWMDVDLTDAASLRAALELIVADWRVPHRYVEPIQRTLFGAADTVHDLLHPELRERVSPPPPPDGGWVPEASSWGVVRPDGSVLTEDELSQAEAVRIAVNLTADHGRTYLPVRQDEPEGPWVPS